MKYVGFVYKCEFCISMLINKLFYFFYWNYVLFDKYIEEGRIFYVL